jgi:membrane protein DedA with SNARE-associated domain
VQAFIAGILGWYFGILSHFGLLGVVALMALESSIFPVPSEMVIPPAAVVCLLDHSPRAVAIMQVALVIFAGTIGSFIGASVTYLVSRVLGRPLVLKYGKYIFVSEKKLQKADHWMLKYGAFGILIARMLPVVRHFISIPAGIVGMRFSTFCSMTLLGSFLWCSVLATFGLLMRKDMLAIIAHGGKFASSLEQQAVQHALHNLTLGLLGLVSVAMVCYWLLARHHEPLISAKDRYAIR